LAHRQKQHIVAQLVVQKVDRVFALGLDHAQMGQGGNALQLSREVVDGEGG
jgi:hypothetical protein